MRSATTVQLGHDDCGILHRLDLRPELLDLRGQLFQSRGLRGVVVGDLLLEFQVLARQPAKLVAQSLALNGVLNRPHYHDDHGRDQQQNDEQQYDQQHLLLTFTKKMVCPASEIASAHSFLQILLVLDL
jgi:hypothetical protein